MISLYLTFLRLLKAVYRSASDEEFRALALVTTLFLASGTWFYAHAEQWNLLDSFYFCVMTITTIDYGDLAPTTKLAKMFAVLYALVSIGVFVSLATKLATGLLHHSRKDRRQRNIENLD